MPGINFKLDTKLMGTLLKNPETIMPAFDRAFFPALEESLALVHSEISSLMPVRTGRLRNSLTSTVRGRSLNFQAILGTPLVYALPVEEGALPHFPPLRPVELWVRRKGLTVSYLGRELSYQQIAFLVARKISRVGFAGKFMFKVGFEKSKSRVMEILEKAQRQVILFMEKG